MTRCGAPSLREQRFKAKSPTKSVTPVSSYVIARPGDGIDEFTCPGQDLVRVLSELNLAGGSVDVVV
jgi:hypothetical protein